MSIGRDKADVGREAGSFVRTSVLKTQSNIHWPNHDWFYVGFTGEMWHFGLSVEGSSTLYVDKD